MNIYWEVLFWLLECSKKCSTECYEIMKYTFSLEITVFNLMPVI